MRLRAHRVANVLIHIGHYLTATVASLDLSARIAPPVQTHILPNLNALLVSPDLWEQIVINA